VAGNGGMADFSKIAGQAVRGVANISSLQVVRTSNSPFGSDPFFRYFYDDDQAFGSRDRRSLSLGSGVMISPDGYVITNNHVVGDNVREITIALPDKREIRGKVVGTDPVTDLALLKIDVKGASVLPWGDSAALKVGEWVLAIGSPFQLSQTVTAGIVSATGRTNVGFADYEDFIQTDAAINPGNSGGALINSRGDLVGINTGIFSESGGYQGIGFAVPSNLARKVVGDLMKYGEVRRGSIGFLRVEKLTDQRAEEFGAASTNGVLVSRMMRDSESYDAGLRPGDVIVQFNNQAVDDPSQFFRMVADARTGSTASLSVLRNGRAMDFKMPIVSSSEAPTRSRR
jgi:Do/DeqQ family serine protease